MRADKKRRLRSRGFAVGGAAEFLELTEAEAAYVELKLEMARRLRERRIAAGLTQTQVAEMMHSSQSRVAKMEAGDPSVSLDLLARVLLQLGERLAFTA